MVREKKKNKNNDINNKLVFDQRNLRMTIAPFVTDHFYKLEIISNIFFD